MSQIHKKNVNPQTKQPTSSQNSPKNIQVIVGLGHSGLSVAHYLAKQLDEASPNFEIAVTDMNPSPTLDAQLPNVVKIRKFGDIDVDLLLSANRIIISPGISLEHPAIAQAKNAGIPIVSDIQLFHEACTVPIVAITGSNAKSTVTTLVGEMAKDANINVGVGGNIGTPALQLLENKDMQLAILELSSFQLETTNNLNAKVATILNMSPDHLDRHGTMAHYKTLKHKIFQGTSSIVINQDDDATIPEADNLPDSVQRISISSDKPSEQNYGLIKTVDEVFLAKGSKKLLNTKELKIKGQHNQMNALSALALGELADIPLDSMLKTLTNFAGLPHRCQFIGTHNHVDYFNDSKGTNIGSTMAAIKGLGESYNNVNSEKSLFLILGGQSKGQNFTEMASLINQYVSHISFIGEDAELIAQQLNNAGLNDVVCKQCQNIDNALSFAIEHNNQLKAVLLSPACASFDQFDGYVHRGNYFIELVDKL